MRLQLCSDGCFGEPGCTSLGPSPSETQHSGTVLGRLKVLQKYLIRGVLRLSAFSLVLRWDRRIQSDAARLEILGQLVLC